MKVTLEFSTGNAAFEDALEETLDKIFSVAREQAGVSIASQIYGGKVIQDINGNMVGWFSCLADD